jgi:Glycosyl hydrolase family 30 beta sandwich domain
MPFRPREGKTVLKVRAAVSALLAATLAVTIAGCSFTNGSIILPRQYDPSDGVGADIGDLDLRNAFLVSEDGERGNLVVSVINTTEDAQPLSVQYESGGAASRETVDLSIPANSTVTFGYGESEQLVLEGIDTQPGALFPVYFQSGDSEGAALEVPVLDTMLAEYDGLTPSPTPTPTPTAVPVPAPTPTEGTIDEGDNSGEGEPGDSVDTAE